MTGLKRLLDHIPHQYGDRDGDDKERQHETHAKTELVDPPTHRGFVSFATIYPDVVNERRLGTVCFLHGTDESWSRPRQSAAKIAPLKFKSLEGLIFFDGRLKRIKIGAAGNADYTAASPRAAMKGRRLVHPSRKGGLG